MELDHNILEPNAGNGNIAEPLKELGFNVKCYDLIQRDYPLDGLWDFLEASIRWNGDVVMNPPYKDALKHIKKALEIIDSGHKVVAFLKIQFLEGKERRKFFDTKQLKTVYVCSSRVACSKGGDITENYSSAVCYCWFEWQKDYNGDPVIKWIN